MADNDLKPATGADLDTPPANTDFTPAEPLKTSGVGFTPEDATISTRPELTDGTGSSGGGKATDVKQTLRDGAGKLQAQAGDKLRAYADDGKAKAGNALDQLSQLLTMPPARSTRSWASNMASMPAAPPTRSRALPRR